MEGGPYYVYAGHSSHVSNVKWLSPCKDLSNPDPNPPTGAPPPREQTLLISAGGADRSIFQWRLVPKPLPLPVAPNPEAAAAKGAVPAAAAAKEAAHLKQPVGGTSAFETRSPSFLVQPHGQSVVSLPLVAPELGSCGSPARAWRLWAARHSQGRGQATERPATASGARASRL